jgi:hypothetical protein
MNKVANDKNDFLQTFLDILERESVSFCIVGGLAVNAYTEPVVSLDLDVVVATDQLNNLISILEKNCSVTRHFNTINITKPSSDFRIQLQLDQRYQPFIERAIRQKVLGYELPVATIEDVLQGKIWAATDETRRRSKRQKDLSDIIRLIETRKDLIALVPEKLKKQLSLDIGE